MRSIAVFVLVCRFGLLKIVHASPAPVDPFAGDPRLQTPNTLRIAGRSFAEFLGDLTRQTGIQFRADASIAEDKLVVYTRSRPLGQVLSAISSFFHFTWIRSGASPTPTYTLTQTREDRHSEEVDPTSRVYETARRILRDLDCFRRIKANPPENTRQRASELGKSLIKSEDPERIRSIESELSAIQHLNNKAFTAAALFFENMTADRVAALIPAGITEYTDPQFPGTEHLPKPLADRVRTLLPQDRAIDKDIPVSVRLDSQLYFAPGLRFRIGVGDDPYSDFSDARMRRTSECYLPRGAAYAIAPKPADYGPANWQTDPKLTVAVGFTVKMDVINITPLSAKPDSPNIPMADAIAALEIGRSVDLISDAFVIQDRFDISIENKPLGQALSELCMMSGHHWWKQDGFVLMRHFDYSTMRAAEPPLRALMEHIHRCETMPLSLDLLAEPSNLTFWQTWSAMKVLARTRRLAPHGIGLGNHLAFWNMLSPEQRRAAQGEGVKVRDMGPSLRKAFVLASTGRLVPREPSAVMRSIPWTEESLAQAVYHVKIKQESGWGYQFDNRGSGGNYTDRETAFAALREREPELKLSDVRAFVDMDLEFDYGIALDQATGGHYGFTQYRK